MGVYTIAALRVSCVGGYRHDSSFVCQWGCECVNVYITAIFVRQCVGTCMWKTSIVWPCKCVHNSGCVCQYVSANMCLYMSKTGVVCLWVCVST